VQVEIYELTSEFERSTRVVDNIKTKQLNRSLQTQKYEINFEFDKKSTVKTTHPYERVGIYKVEAL